MDVARVLRTAGRSVVRGYGMITASTRPLPDFLIIGAKRGGTTGLYYTLLRNPQVVEQFPSARVVPKRRDTKGVHFFDSHFSRGVRWYRAHFPTERTLRARSGEAGGRAVTGEASPYYLYHPLVADRAAQVVPLARLIVVLRNPIERAFSHFREQTRNGVETLSWEEAIDAEPARTAGEEDRILRNPCLSSFAHEQQSYVGQSEYARSLSRWFTRYPREQFHVCRSEDLWADPQRVIDEIARFLGLQPRRLTHVVPRNAAPVAEMIAGTRARLEEHFEPHVRELEDLLGQRLGWDPW